MGYVLKEDHNYCRNPNESDKGLWCFTNNKHIRYGTCNEPSDISGKYPKPPNNPINYNTILKFDNRIKSSDKNIKIKQGLTF